MIIQDIIKEFALLTDKSGVLENFDRSASDHPGYAALKAEIEAFQDAPVLPEIKDFIFGLNADAVNERIRTITGPFMLLDYGIIRGNNVLRDAGSSLRFIFSAIIAQPFNSRNLDPMEEMLWNDTLMGYVTRMLKHFEAADINRCATKRMLDGGVTISPVEPAVLLNCVGWDVSFERNASEIMQ